MLPVWERTGRYNVPRLVEAPGESVTLAVEVDG